MFRNKINWITLILFIFLFTTYSFAQGTTGRISGTVSDPNGASGRL